MNVLVCIKQVPSRSVPIDGSSGVLDRSQAGGRINPWDLYALEAALRIAEKTGGQVTALTMGPESAEKSLKTALSMGAQSGVLLSHRAFAGADVYATAFTLAQGIRSLGTFDVVVCGQQTTDGDTAQLPFSLAVQLGIPAVGWVKGLAVEGDTLCVQQELSGGTQQVKITAPCLLAVGEGIGKPRIPSLREQLRARSREIRRIGLSDLENKDPDCYGLAASPTRVVSVSEIHQTAHAPAQQLPPNDAAEKIFTIWQRAREEGAYGG